MSAFILARAHIDYLVSAGWVYGLSRDLVLERVAEEMARMLERANLASVFYRYRERALQLFGTACGKVPITKIVFAWSESPDLEDGTTFDGADAWLLADAAVIRIAQAKQSGGYDKTAFTLHWADGRTYEGRIDVLCEMRSEAAPLTKHVVDFCAFSSGRRRPSHMTDERHREYLNAQEKHAPGSAEDFAKVLDAYQVGQAQESPRPVNLTREVDPVQVLKALECYEHQSCEHPGWESSSARAWCDSLRQQAIAHLPGYDAAAWAIGDAPTS